MALFNKKRQPAPLTRDQALTCVPVRSNIVSWKRISSGQIQIEYSLALKPFLSSILERFNKSPVPRPTRKLELDELGSQVWELLDGSRTTADIINEFAESHNLTIQEAEQSVTLFLRELGKRNLIGLR